MKAEPKLESNCSMHRYLSFMLTKFESTDMTRDNGDGSSFGIFDGDFRLRLPFKTLDNQSSSKEFGLKTLKQYSIPFSFIISEHEIKLK